MKDLYVDSSPPATPRQKSAIARMAIALGIREPIEEAEMTRIQARNMTYDLLRQVRGKNAANSKRKSGSHT